MALDASKPRGVYGGEESSYRTGLRVGVMPLPRGRDQSARWVLGGRAGPRKLVRKLCQPAVSDKSSPANRQVSAVGLPRLTPPAAYLTSPRTMSPPSSGLAMSPLTKGPR